MDEVNVAVIAPIVGRDLSFVSEVDPRVRVLDANFAAPGRRSGPGSQVGGARPAGRPSLPRPRCCLSATRSRPGLAALLAAPGVGASHPGGGLEPGRDRPVGLGGHLDEQPRRDGGHGDRRVRPRRGGALRPGPARGRPPEGRRPVHSARVTRCSPCAGRRWGSSAWAASARKWPGCRARPACG